MRINQMITKEKCLDLILNSLNLFIKEMYGDQFGEFVRGYWGLTLRLPGSPKSELQER